MLIVLWLLFAGTSAVIAHAKGRNALGWFVIGFLTGIFGLVAACAVPAIRPAPPTAERSDI